MPSQIEKLEAHASHLLDAFIRLREAYALLEPMLFNEDVPKRRGSYKQARGFKILRHSLFLSCSQDIAKLTNDNFDSTPSIKKLVSVLDQHDVRLKLQKRFSDWVIPSIEEHSDPEIIEALKHLELREQAERFTQFDDIVNRIKTNWDSLLNQPYLNGFQKIRDKVSAHTEIQFVVDKYAFYDIGTFGINWGDIKLAIIAMESIIDDLNQIFRNSGFAWEMLEIQLTKASLDFWNT